MAKKTSNELLVKRGPAPSQHLSKKTRQSRQPSRVASEFLSHNRQGSTRVFVAGGSRSGRKKIYEKQAFQLGQEIGKRRYRLDFGLSSRGVMGAVAKGVLNTWAELGRTHQIPIQGITTKEYLALYQSDSVLDEVSNIIVAKTLEERKKQLLNADFVIFAPGGVGTLDELVYDCVAMQDGFLPFKPFILFNVEGFFHHLLEFLKELDIKGFADQLPFIVVDDSFEAGIAFDMISFYKIQQNNDKQKTFEAIQQLIHDLPYVILQKKNNDQLNVSDILCKMTEQQNGSPRNKKRINAAIEEAYLTKEIERMYHRLGKTGTDTSVMSHKLTQLKQRFYRKKT